MEGRGHLANAVGNWSGGSETNDWGRLWNQLDRFKSANLYPCPQRFSAGHGNKDARGGSGLTSVTACLWLHGNALVYTRNRLKPKEKKHYWGWQQIRYAQATGPNRITRYPANKCITAAANCGAGKG